MVTTDTCSTSRTPVRPSEAAQWLPDVRTRATSALPQPPSRARLDSRAFPESGYFLLQSGRRNAADRISHVFDCGSLGYGALAAHGHADALSFTRRAFGVDVLVDAGTYDYFSSPRWREYFRSTRAHNTIVIDDHDQSEMRGLLLWERKAQSRCVSWTPTNQGGRVVGEHDGYTRLDDPVVHRRSVELDGTAGRISIRDEILARQEHDMSVYSHLSETCRMRELSRREFTIDTGAGEISLGLDSCLSVNRLSALENCDGGWVSPCYHQRLPGTTLVGRCRAGGEVTLTCELQFDDAMGNTVRRLPVRAGLTASG